MSGSPTGARWTPGTHHGLVWSDGIALLDGSLDPAAAELVWEHLLQGAELRTFFSELADASGLRLLDLPSFAVALRTPDGGAHLAARGAFVAIASGDSGEASVAGDGVTTWREASLESADQLQVNAVGAVAGSDLPVVGGVVPAGLILLAPAGADRALVATPAPMAAAPTAMAPAEPASPAAPVEPPHPEPEVAEPEPEVAVPEPEVAEPEVDGSPPDLSHLRGEQTMVPAAEDTDEPEPEAPAEAVVETPPAPAPSAWSPPDLGIISGVPKPDPAAPSTPGDHDGHTVIGVAGAADPGGEPDDGLGDHDGYTIMQSGDTPPTPPTWSAETAGSDDLVLATVCPSGHANPPQRATCRVCSQPLPTEPQRVRRPAMGRVLASTGETIELTGPVIVGRDPRAARFQGTDMPRLLAMPHAHVSASHLEIRIEGWSVLAVDLRSTNGTFLRRHGQPPVRLPEAPHLLVSDDVLDLGHGLHLTFEELP